MTKRWKRCALVAAAVAFMTTAILLLGACSSSSQSGFRSDDAPAASSTQADSSQGELTGESESASEGEDGTDAQGESIAADDARSGADVPKTASSAKMTVEFLDVGQGDCALVSLDGHHLLIDGGPPQASQKVYAVLKEREIDHLDAIIASHPDDDHIGGLSGALNYAACDVLYCSADESDTRAFASLVSYANRQGLSLEVPEAGESFMLGEARVLFVGPTRSFDNENDGSLVCRIDYGDVSFLFTGDISQAAESALVSSNAPLAADVLKVPHHGSNGSSGSRFLRAVAPQYAVISVGADNSYGHPTRDALNRLGNVGAQVLRTDLNGDIVFSTDGTTLSEGHKFNREDPALTKLSQQDEIDRAQEKGYSFILNTSSRKFHEPGCSSVGKMKEKNREEFYGTRDEALARGYDPCKRCNP